MLLKERRSVVYPHSEMFICLLNVYLTYFPSSPVVWTWMSEKFFYLQHSPVGKKNFSFNPVHTPWEDGKQVKQQIIEILED